MTEAEFDALIQACDRCLTAPDRSPDTVALEWLHVLSEHPHNLSQYETVFGRAFAVSWLRRRLRHHAARMLTLAASAASPIDTVLLERVTYPARVDVLFLSHIVSPDVPADAPDFYYGDLANELASRGVTSLTALHNHFPRADRKLRKRLTRGGPTSRVVLPRWSTLAREWRHIQRARSAGKRLLAHAGEGSGFARRIAREASAHAANPASLAALRVGHVVRELCSTFQPKALITTWEGHAWERIAFKAAREVVPAIHCIGYQHTVLFARSHALMRSLGRAYDADSIITLGDVNRDALQARKDLAATPIFTYGSHRRPSTRALTPNNSRECLVIPDGLESECLILFDFTLHAALRMPDILFRLRMHPVLPFEKFARRHSRFKVLPRNVHVSTRSDINDDFVECAWALYRGSSAVVHSVLMGVRPIYLERPNELSIDPLFAMHGWRRRVTSGDALAALIEGDRLASTEGRRLEWEPARVFCDRYVVQSNPEIVRALVLKIVPDVIQPANLSEQT